MCVVGKAPLPGTCSAWKGEWSPMTTFAPSVIWSYTIFTNYIDVYKWVVVSDTIHFVVYMWQTGMVSYLLIRIFVRHETVPDSPPPPPSSCDMGQWQFACHKMRHRRLPGVEGLSTPSLATAFTHVKRTRTTRWLPWLSSMQPLLVAPGWEKEFKERPA